MQFRYYTHGTYVDSVILTFVFEHILMPQNLPSLLKFVDRKSSLMCFVHFECNASGYHIVSAKILFKLKRPSCLMNLIWNVDSLIFWCVLS